MKRKIWSIIHAFFRVPVFEKILLPLVKGKFSNEKVVRFAPPFNTYKNPTYRVATKGLLKLHGNMYDYNDWKAYWGIKEVEREALYQLAQNARVAVDIGTNNGWVLMNLAAITAKNNGFVYGFEPFPDTYNRCLKNLASSSIHNAEVFNLGCGEKAESFVMEVILESNSGQNRIIGEKNTTFPGKKTVHVKVVRLDEQLSGTDKIDLVKIDVEGFELHVLKGADNLLKKFKPVLFMEVNDPLLKANNTSPKEVLNFLKQNYQYSFKNAADQKPVYETDNFDNRQLDVICFHEK